MKPTIALVAGEASGDLLGGALIAELRLRHPDARFVGIGGNNMRGAGMETWWDSEELAVFGLFEVLSHFPRLYKIRRKLRRRLRLLQPDVFIGIDAPDFNLGLEIGLRRSGIRTVQYVSPTVWAWRAKRTKKISRAADLVLCLFPFEPDFYRENHVAATYVGHPMADQIALHNDPAAARGRLGLETTGAVVALLPGSRIGEVSRLAEPMLDATRIIADECPDARFISAMANSRVRAIFEAALRRQESPAVAMVDSDPRSVIAAADVVIVASGTAALETLLINRPMVICYRMAASSYRLVKSMNLIKTEFVSLPNILAGEALVPELLQDEANSARMAQAALRWLQDGNSRGRLQERFTGIHLQLQCNASENAAEAVSALLSKPK